jgi:uncharacterized membrane protein YraQ (UPF0718 family)
MKRSLVAFVVCCMLAAACFFLAHGSRVALAWWLAGIALDVTALVIVVRILAKRSGASR